MLELTQEQCKELENRVVEKFKGELHQEFARIATMATIHTIREYEKMKKANTDTTVRIP